MKIRRRFFEAVVSVICSTLPLLKLECYLRGLSSWANLWIYLVADFVGGAVAAGAFKAVNPTDN